MMKGGSEGVREWVGVGKGRGELGVGCVVSVEMECDAMIRYSEIKVKQDG